MLKNKWMKTRQVPMGLGSSPGSSFLGEPSFLVHCCPSGSGDQRPGPELSERATVYIFFFPLQVPKIGFRREVSKQLSKREEYSLPLLGSDQARGWRMEDPGESSEIKYRLAPPDLCEEEASWNTAPRKSPAF